MSPAEITYRIHQLSASAPWGGQRLERAIGRLVDDVQRHATAETLRLARELVILQAIRLSLERDLRSLWDARRPSRDPVSELRLPAPRTWPN